MPKETQIKIQKEILSKEIPCPHQAVAHNGGGNWGHAYYDSRAKAKKVDAWVRAGSNTKWGGVGRTDGIETWNYGGLKLWAIHHHYDNTRGPSSCEKFPTSSGVDGTDIKDYVLYRESQKVK